MLLAVDGDRAAELSSLIKIALQRLRAHPAVPGAVANCGAYSALLRKMSGQ